MGSIIWFINWVDNVNWPPLRDLEADVSSVTPSVRANRIDLGGPHMSNSFLRDFHTSHG